MSPKGQKKKPSRPHAQQSGGKQGPPPPRTPKGPFKKKKKAIKHNESTPTTQKGRNKKGSSWKKVPGGQVIEIDQTEQIETFNEIEQNSDLKKANPSGRGGHQRGAQRGGRQAASPLDKGDQLTIEIEDMVNGGYGLGRYKGRTIFVPYTIPGEHVRVEIVRQGQRNDFAKGVHFADVSVDRVEPECEHFGPGRCWGCQWQHINYKAQVLIKSDVLVDQLSRLGGFDDATLERCVRDMITAPEIWQYNHRLPLIRGEDGQLGLRGENGRFAEPIKNCLQVDPELMALVETLDIEFEGIRGLELLLGANDESMLVLDMNVEDAPELSADFPTSVNIVLPDNEPMNLVGDSAIRFEVGERLFRVTAGSYFRPNVKQIDQLIPIILEGLSLRGHESVLELYAGVGVFTAFIASRAELVTMVESYPPAVTDAELNLEGFDNVDIVEGIVEEVLESMLDEGATYDYVLTDPTGHGLGKDVIDLLDQMKVKKIVYVSSNPATLAKDGQELVKRRYKLSWVQPIDFAPQTYYMDAVAVFSR